MLVNNYFHFYHLIELELTCVVSEHIRQNSFFLNLSITFFFYANNAIMKGTHSYAHLFEYCHQFHETDMLQLGHSKDTECSDSFSFIWTDLGINNNKSAFLRLP